ncbi:ATP synthase protein I [Sphingomonas laterariae]|uniref:ATP synthase protein I n=1 Tax=Edaphosphingomonas laterariae TaxID=861865 RepID=A0A239G6Y9_9SPHN|nr:AtpZ/AtpI family protein [Sphingomonas laterariae]SNS64870.1 ATP synthase protein I [Sphingomonas laterariae]
MAKDEPGQDPPSVEDARLTSLQQRLKAAAEAERDRTATKQAKPGKGYSQGNRVLAELIAGPAVGALVGWVLDRWLGTTPWILLAMLFLGIGVGFRNIIRISNERPE